MDSFSLGYFDGTPSVFDALPPMPILGAWMLLAILAGLRGPTRFVWFSFLVMVAVSMASVTTIWSIAVPLVITVLGSAVAPYVQEGNRQSSCTRKR